MKDGVRVEIVTSKQRLGRRLIAGTARLWVGESEEGKVQVAFHPPGDDLLLTEEADKAAEQFYKGYLIQPLLTGDDSTESQIRETRRFWAELLACQESWGKLCVDH